MGLVNSFSITAVPHYSPTLSTEQCKTMSHFFNRCKLKFTIDLMDTEQSAGTKDLVYALFFKSS